METALTEANPTAGSAGAASPPPQDSAALRVAGVPLPAERVIQIDQDSALVRARDGLFLVNVHDVYVGQALMIYGELVRDEALLLKRLCRPGDVVVEVGANIGAHTVGLARHILPDGRMLAIEPQPAIFHYLAANIALNGLLNVRCLPVGLGSRRGAMIVPPLDYRRTNNFGGVSLQAAGAGTRVRIARLDDVFEDSALRLIKIDVEGMERDVVEGAANVINRFRPILYLENDRVEKSRALIETLFALGYRLWWHTPALFSAENFFGERNNPYPNIVSMNMIGLPRELPSNLPAAREITDPAHHPLRR